MGYFVVYTKDGKVFDFGKRCDLVDVLNETNDLLCFIETYVGSRKRTLAIFPKDIILYILAEED